MQIASPKPQYIPLVLGVIAFSVAVLYLYMGKVWDRFNGWVYRKERPIYFWVDGSLCVAGELVFVGYFLSTL